MCIKRTHRTEVGKQMEKRMVNMRYPLVLLNKIEAYQEDKGFTTRTQAIIHLIQVGLERVESDKGKDDET